MKRTRKPTTPAKKPTTKADQRKQDAVRAIADAHLDQVVGGAAAACCCSVCH